MLPVKIDLVEEKLNLLMYIKQDEKTTFLYAIYFDSNAEIIKETCEFQYYYNKTDIIPSVLDGGSEII